jgi:AraC family transcriptional regulator of adaptative response / DNA-3-methyladenine glycosylase II
MLERMGMTRDVLDRARRSRDARFDGKFFIAVTSTGIYCRSICPAKTSKDANVRYYATAAEAAEAGFRPCLRCRPETAPGSPAWLGTSAVVRRALRLIQNGALDQSPVEALATRLGVGARHLGRLFNRHLGTSPAAVARTRRLHFAKQLLDETSLPITQIALASGFGSVRRFNDAFKATYRRSPRELRKTRRQPVDADIRLRLTFRPPYDWPAMLESLERKLISGLEQVSEGVYRRAVRTAAGSATVEVSYLDDADALELRILGGEASDLLPLASAVRRMFDLSADPARIREVLARDAQLAPSLARRPGLRIAGDWDAFESGVRALVGAHSGAGAAPRALTRLLASAGEALPVRTAELHLLFPTASALARADPARLDCAAALARRLQQFAAQVAQHIQRGVPPDEAVRASLPASSAASYSLAEHVSLFGLGDPDALPHAATALRARLAAAALSDAELRARTEAWRPFRGYAAAHLLDAAGALG